MYMRTYVNTFMCVYIYTGVFICLSIIEKEIEGEMREILVWSQVLSAEGWCAVLQGIGQ